MADSNELIKVSIFAYDDRNFFQSHTAEVGKFVIPVNPESFSKSFKIQLDTRTGQGNDGTAPEYLCSVPEELKLDFILDGTNTIEGYKYNDDSKTSVHDQLEAFLAVVYNLSGKIHRPRFLKVFWGSDINFPCVLSSLDVNYTLFAPSGDPLRVKVSANFLNYVAQEAREAQARKSSPDLSHYKKATADDRLFLLTYKIYNDSRYLLQVAKANGLTSTRNLLSGTDLYFPPFDKKEA